MHGHCGQETFGEEMGFELDLEENGRDFGRWREGEGEDVGRRVITGRRYRALLGTMTRLVWLGSQVYMEELGKVNRIRSWMTLSRSQKFGSLQWVLITVEGLDS